MSQFRGARYREAYDVFQKLEQSHPDMPGLVLCRALVRTELERLGQDDPING